MRMTTQDWIDLSKRIAEQKRLQQQSETCEVCGYEDCDWLMPTPCSCEPADCPEDGHG